MAEKARSLLTQEEEGLSKAAGNQSLSYFSPAPNPKGGCERQVGLRKRPCPPGRWWHSRPRHRCPQPLKANLWA